MKIAHECPLSIFDKVQAITDYDYALVHLFEEKIGYYKKFEEARDKGREIILDNSIFELGTAWDSDRFAYWVKKLKPTWYIVPDVLDNGPATIKSFKTFMEKYPDLPGKTIAVAQGKTYKELVSCYKFLNTDPRVDKIGLSFNHPFYQEEYASQSSNKYEAMVKGRQSTIDRLFADVVINENKPHHLLGCGLPQEFAYYKFAKWIDSIDTSNPVLHGIQGIRYERQPLYDLYGLSDKDPLKMYTIMSNDVNDMWDDIQYNIDMFRRNITPR